MNKAVKILLIAITSIVVGCILIAVCVMGLVFGIIGKTANEEEYKLGDDTIKTVKAVVGKRQVVSTSTESSNGMTTRRVEYKSESVQEDLAKYIQYLRETEGFTLTGDMNLTKIPSTVHLGKESSVNKGKLLMITIEYDAFGYTITIQKGNGTLSLY